MAETERENIRESTLEGLDAAARKGKHGGRPPVITADMLHTVLRRRANNESVEQIQPDLIIPTGKRKGQHTQRRQHLPCARRAREDPGVPRGRRSGPCRLRRPASALNNGFRGRLTGSLLTVPILPRGRIAEVSPKGDGEAYVKAAGGLVVEVVAGTTRRPVVTVVRIHD
ncbi:hypothetical protein ACFWBH_01410 [Streptomyces sp. NPDC059999]|uniref:hypothetical protein n=1 Tax=Streptomyces sp. NPDC059999 TaxID=3347030 RepID=UPI0036D01753